jgi:3-oxoacyl-(acyl-carrier-protein) synthase
VVITGMGVVSAYGRGQTALLSGLASSKPAFSPVSRFDVTRRRAHVAATFADAGELFTELTGVIEAACAEAGLDRHPVDSTAGAEPNRSGVPLHLAFHGDPAVSRAQEPQNLSGAFASRLAAACGLDAGRVYTSACVAASTAVADAAAAISLGDAETIVVAGGYLVEQDQFALFDAGRALAVDGEVRPFSAGRKGIVMGDGVAAIVLTSRPVGNALARVSGWGRSGDAYHVCQPIPDGSGMARAIEAALRRAELAPDGVGYVNAHGSGSVLSDAAEARALQVAFGQHAGGVPVSSTKSLHGQSLEASPLVELVSTVLSMRSGLLPVNAGFLAPDPDCPLNLILHEPLAAAPAHALSLNSAFGGANTALIVSRP